MTGIKKGTQRIFIIVTFLYLTGCHTAPSSQKAESNSESNSLTRIRYNNPGVITELGVGLCSLPMPVDYNKDGLIDLVVTAGQDVPDGYTYFFENTGEKSDGIDVFKPGVRIGPKHEYYTPSYVNGDLRVLAYNREHDLHNLSESREIYPDKDIHVSSGRIRANQWSYVDYDGNDVLDLIVGIGDWRDYGWDDAFNEKGEWTAGPLHGYVYFIRNAGTDSIPRYEKPEMIKLADGSPIDVYGRPSPNFADFNGDGNLDLITGEFVDKLTFFKNVGTRQAPRYAAGVKLKFRNEVIKLKGCMIRPVAFDWTGDGHLDLIVGAEEGTVALIRNTGRLDAGVPVFEPPVYFRQLGHELKAGVLITPVGVDWNDDGRQDIIAGNAGGNINFFENLGGDPPKWAAPTKLEADGEVIHVMAGYNGSIQGPAEEKWGYTVVSVADWNADGLPDILMNSILGRIVWFENIGTKGKPVLAAQKPIEVEWAGDTPSPIWNWWKPDGKELVTQWRSTVQAIDLNKDGLPDLVGLDQEGFLVVFNRRKDGQGQLKLMPPRRIFFVEGDSVSAFSDRHRPMFLADEGGQNELAGYDENGKLGYYGRKWQGHRWGPDQIIRREQPLQGLDHSTSEHNGLLPLRLNGGWAGRSGRRKFVLADWTGDGKLDLLVNSYNVNLMENISESEDVFVFRDRGRLDEVQLAGHTSCPTVVNWNGDDRPDLLVGAEDGYLYYLENKYINK